MDNTLDPKEEKQEDLSGAAAAENSSQLEASAAKTSHQRDPDSGPEVSHTEPASEMLNIDSQTEPNIAPHALPVPASLDPEPRPTNDQAPSRVSTSTIEHFARPVTDDLMSNNGDAEPDRTYLTQHDSENSSTEGIRDFQEGMMTVVEHLDELRIRLFRCLGYAGTGCVIGLFLSKKVMRLLEAPAGNISFQALSLEEPILVFFKVACYTGLICASPFILFEISQFVAPGLTKKEKQIVTPIVIGSPVLFACGALFAYYCLLRPMLHFFGAFGSGVAPINQRLDFYISLVSSILLYMGLCFQLPIIIFALSFTGLVNSTQLVKVWRYAILGASLIAAVITPDPTAISMLIVMAALIGLYFLSVLMLKLFGR
jgi:sec-independent protein translocase protein TatC